LLAAASAVLWLAPAFRLSECGLAGCALDQIRDAPSHGGPPNFGRGRASLSRSGASSAGSKAIGSQRSSRRVTCRGEPEDENLRHAGHGREVGKARRNRRNGTGGRVVAIGSTADAAARLAQTAPADSLSLSGRRNRGVRAMNMHPTRALTLPALLLAMAQCHAGPCSKQIEEMQTQIDSRLDAAAAAGPAAAESSAALRHRQPTPESIATAEANLGDVAKATALTITQTMSRARDADAAGDQAGCEQALREARRALGN
jgi:F0F1-type ATP synthase membrane subunit b/b'